MSSAPRPARQARWAVVILAVVLALSAPGRAAADETGGRLHFGAGAFWVIPTFQAHERWVGNLREDFGLSGELLYDRPHWFVAASAGGSWLTGKPATTLIAARGGLTLNTGAHSPFVAIGLGYLNESGLRTTLDNCGPGPSQAGCDPVEGSGAALLAEAGVLLFRSSSVGLVSISATYVVPFFDVDDPFFSGIVNDRLPLVWLGVRLYH